MNSNTHAPRVHIPIPLYCDQPTQTGEDSETVADSELEESDPDFPPCHIGNRPPLMSETRYSCSSGSPDAVPPRSRHPLAAMSSPQRQPITGISGENLKEPQSQHRRLPNTGLGQINIVNTTATVLNTKVILYVSQLNVAMLI